MVSDLNNRLCDVCDEMVDLPQHLTKVHSFVLLDCCLLELENHLVEHFVNTGAGCPECGILQGDLNRHLCDKHECHLCQHCGKVFKDLPAHIQEDHDGLECQICGVVVAEEKLNSHLIGEHCWKQCPICDTLMPAEAVRKHLEQELQLFKRTKAGGRGVGMLSAP
jgi:hypothetical protein